MLSPHSLPQTSYLPPQRRRHGLRVLALAGVSIMGAGLWLGIQGTLAQKGLTSTPLTLAPLTSNLSAIFLSPGGTYALGNSADLTALEALQHNRFLPEEVVLGLHNPQTGQLLWKQTNLRVHQGCFSPEGRRFVAQTYQHGKTFVTVQDTFSGKRLWQSTEPRKLSIEQSSLSAEGRFLLTHGKALELWDVEKNLQVARFALAAPPGFFSASLSGVELALSPDGQWAAESFTVSPSPEALNLQIRDVSFVGLWHVGQSQPVAFLPVNAATLSLTFSPDSQTLYTSSLTSTQSMGYSGSSGCPIGAFSELFTAQEKATTRDQFEELTAQIYAKRPQPEYGSVGTLQPVENAFGMDERGFRGTYGNGATVAWSVTDGKPRWVHYSRWASPLALSPDGTKLALRNDDGLTILEAKTGKTLHQALLGPNLLPTARKSPYSFEFSADGKSVREDYLNGWTLTAQRWDLSRVPDVAP